MVGKPHRKGCCAVLGSAAEGFLLKCANGFALLEPQQDHEEEESCSAVSSHEQTPSVASEKDVNCSMGVVVEQIPSAQSEDVVTCSTREFFGVANQHLGDTAVACPLSPAHPGSSSQDLHTPILDDETWLSDVHSSEATVSYTHLRAHETEADL
eukprot:590643-Amphidinium_carterae.1